MKNKTYLRLTKDELYILSVSLADYKYKLTDEIADTKNYPRPQVFKILTDLEKYVGDYSKDRRRTGRKSQDDFTDRLKRYIKSKAVDANQ